MPNYRYHYHTDDQIFDDNGDPISGSPGGGTAATTTFEPAGSIAATDVQAAIEELDTEKSATGHSHGGSTPAAVSSAGLVYAAATFR